MIYLLYGLDHKTKKNKSQKILGSLKTNQILQMTDLDFSSELVGNLIYGDSMFDSKEAIVFNSVLENKDILNFVLSKLDKMNDSKMTFIFLEQKIAKEIINEFKESGAEIEEFKLVKKVEKVNPFAVTNYIGSRDKKNAWISFQKAIQNQAEPEALAGMIFWKIKSMIIEKDTRKYSEQELLKLSSKIISIYHEGHRGVGDIEIGLERLILENI